MRFFSRERRPVRPRRLAAATLVLGLLVAACGGAEQDGQADSDGAGEEAGADPAGNPLEGELISMVVPFSTGGGYDTDARLIAEFLGDELGADMVVENEPGAGGLLAVNRVASLGEEATTIAIANGTGLGGAALGGAEGMEFELTELTFLGRHGYDPKVLVVGGDSPWESVEDFVADADNVRWGATGPGASTYVDVYLMAASLGIDLDSLDIVTGFDGGSDVEAAIVAGEVDAMVSSVSGRMSLFESGDLRPLVIAGREPYEGLEDVPLIADTGPEGEQERIVEDFLNNNELGRPIIGPPDMPEDAVEAYRSALENLYDNEEFLAEADARGRDIAFMSGEEYEQLVSGFADASEPFIQVLTRASE